MRNLTLTAKQRTRTADLLEKTALAVLIAILGARESTVWHKLGGGGIALLLAVASIRVEYPVGRRR